MTVNMNSNPPKFYSIQDILIASRIVANDLASSNQSPLNSAHDVSMEGKEEKTAEKRLNENDKSADTKGNKPALRCNRCSRCSKANCGICFACKDMPQFGGQNKLNQDCLQRHCIFFVFDPPKVSTETVSDLVDDNLSPQATQTAACPTRIGKAPEQRQQWCKPCQGKKKCIFLSDEKEKNMEESDALAELFNSPDSDPITKPPDNTFKADMSQTEFINLVFSLKGLVSMLEQECSMEEDKLRVLDSFSCRPSHPVYEIFKIINIAFSTGNIEFLQSTGVWMEEAVKAVGRLLQVPVVHIFLRDTTDICHEFINFCLQSVAQCPGELRDNLCHLMSYLAGHKTLGNLLVNGILDMLPTIAEQLREADNFMCADEEFMDVFHNLMGLILQVWPKYVSQLIWHPDPTDQVPKSKRRASAAPKEKKPEVRRPKLLFTETAQLKLEISGWRELLDNCTVSLSITQPIFCGKSINCVKYFLISCNRIGSQILKIKR